MVAGGGAECGLGPVAAPFAPGRPPRGPRTPEEGKGGRGAEAASAAAGLRDHPVCGLVRAPSAPLLTAAHKAPAAAADQARRRGTPVPAKGGDGKGRDSP